MAKRWHTKRHKLSMGEREHMPSKDFALPGKGEGKEGKGSGSYPINDEKHARAALSRGAANASPAEQATIKRKVHEKFPGMKITGSKERRKALYDHSRS